jgi:LmbE family N-acetylglucosaminyl deacetylase
MKPTPNSTEDRRDDAEPILCFGAHPDDIEFGCGGIIARETQAGRKAHFVICTDGGASSHGTPQQRAAESMQSAKLLGATLEFVALDGDAHLESKVAHSIKLARIIRAVRPAAILAPSPVKNQHPDHARLGELARDSARLARYGALQELLDQPPHTIEQLFFYAVTPDGEPNDITPIFVDISAPPVIAAWTAAMEAHVTQVSARSYIELQMARARLLGTRAGIDYAAALYPNEPLVFTSLASAGRGARRF